jgi:carbon-monoxide dehydrogenase iron sulfur subunit
MKKIYINESVCIGCHLCEIYCQLQHAKHKDLVKAFKSESPRALPRVRVEEKGSLSFSVRCQHCDDAPCVQVCLTGALSRGAVNGVIVVDEDKCAGCWTCILVCPFGAIKQDINKGKTIRCDLCEREEIPLCVANCPNEALTYIEVKNENRDIGAQSIDPDGRVLVQPAK